MKMRAWAAFAATAATVTAGSLTPATAATASPCTKGVTNCKVITTQDDVNGDRLPDRIAVSWQDRMDKYGFGYRRFYVRVNTAGTKAVKSQKLVWHYDSDDVIGSQAQSLHPRLGNIDNRSGKDIALILPMGGNSVTYRTITYRDGKLQTFKSPVFTDWFTQNKALNKSGWLRSTWKGKVYFTNRIGEAQVDPKSGKVKKDRKGRTQYTITSTKYRLDGTKWKKVRTGRTTTLDKKKFNAISGLRF